MKKLGAVVAVMLVAFCAVAATNEVTSVNAVGFIRTTVPQSGWALVALQFSRLDAGATVTVADVFPDAPNGSRAWYYRSGAWASETKGFGGWVPGTNEFIRGDALFLNAPSDQGTVEYTVMGEVPGASSGPDSTVVVEGGWTLMGFSYPSDIALTNTTLDAQAVSGDRVWWWDSGWLSTTKGFGGWDIPTLVLNAGEGYFFNNTSATFDWTETKPYAWP